MSQRKIKIRILWEMKKMNRNLTAYAENIQRNYFYKIRKEQ